MNSFFKIASLILALCILLVLYGIYSRMNESRYVVYPKGEGLILFDTKTNDFYFHSNYKWHRISNDGDESEVKELPK